MPIETPRDKPELQIWTAPLMEALRSSDASTLQHIFTSLKEYLRGVQTTISSNYYNLNIGSVSVGTAAASITGTFPNQTLNLVLQTGPAGPTGPTGPQGTPGYSILNIDGGEHNSIYGGLPVVDCGSI